MTGHRIEFPRAKLHWALRGFDRAGQALNKVGLLRLPLDEESVCAAAKRKTGLSDFGDERFRIGLRGQLEAQDVFERTPFIGRFVGRFAVVRALSNRLMIENCVKQHPEILQLGIPRPIVIVGLPRTGTTLLQNLLAQDPACRPLMLWEAISPVPESTPLAAGQQDPRLRRAERVAWAVERVAPGLSRLHPFGPKEPHECGTLFRPTFILPGFGKNPWEWFQSLTREQKCWAYGEYRRQLQILQWQRPAKGHWLLKWPMHLFAMDTLAETLADAAILQTHRDPLDVIPSMCQLALNIAFFFGDERWSDLPQVVFSGTVGGLRLAAEARQRIPEGRVFDVSYRRLVAEPLSVLREIYSHFGYDYTDEFDRRASDWLARHPKPERAKKYHDLKQFGICPEEVRSALRFYYEQHEFGSDR